MAKDLLKKDKKNRLLQNLNGTIKEERRKIKKKQRSKERKDRTKNAGSFKKLLNNKNVLNDINFFQNKLSVEEQKKIIFWYIFLHVIPRF